jgi:cytochrome c peroxidase
VNRAYGRSFFWDGRSRSLEEQVLEPITDANEMDLSISEASNRTRLSAGEISRALATFVRSLLSGDAAYDRFTAGDDDALTARQKNGLAIFRGKANCASCHSGPNLTDERLHNTGVAWQAGTMKDDGGGNGSFKTPTLREIARSAPYMHDGSLATLHEVIEYYDRGGNKNPHLDPEIRSLGLTAVEKGDLLDLLSFTLEGGLSRR